MFGDAMSIFAGSHPPQQVEVLVDGAITVRAVATGFGQRAAILANLVGRQAVHEGLAVGDQTLGVLVQQLEVVRGIEDARPLEPEPVYVRLDRLDVLDILFRRVRVIEPQVALALELLSDAEVQADRLGVADVEVAVRFRWEPRIDASSVLAGGPVFRDDFTDEIERRRSVQGIGLLVGRGHAIRVILLN